MSLADPIKDVWAGISHREIPDDLPLVGFKSSPHGGCFMLFGDDYHDIEWLNEIKYRGSHMTFLYNTIKTLGISQYKIYHDIKCSKICGKHGVIWAVPGYLRLLRGSSSNNYRTRGDSQNRPFFGAEKTIPIRVCTWVGIILDALDMHIDTQIYLFVYLFIYLHRIYIYIHTVHM